MKIYRVTEALQELSLTGQKPFVLIAPMNPQKKRNIFFLTVYRRNKNVGRWESDFEARSHGLFLLISQLLSRVITSVR